jgi:hypothetical protein
MRNSRKMAPHKSHVLIQAVWSKTAGTEQQVSTTTAILKNKEKEIQVRDQRELAISPQTTSDDLKGALLAVVSAKTRTATK